MDARKKNILLAGGSGYLGSLLGEHFRSIGWEVKFLSRNPRNRKDFFQWDPAKGTIDEQVLDWTEVLINLSGENVGKSRWTSKRKKDLLDSRIIPTRFLVDKINAGQFPNLEKFINASAIGIYPLGYSPLGEEEKAGETFFGELVFKWEQEAKKINRNGVQLILPRIGVVLGKESEAFTKMLLPFKYGVGSPLGNGKQIMPWIHVKDLIRAFKFFATKNAVGPINCVAPVETSNREFSKAMAKRVAMPNLLPPVPAFALRLIFGEMAGMILGSISVSAQKILDLGFDFQFPDLDWAMEDLMGSD